MEFKPLFLLSLHIKDLILLSVKMRLLTPMIRPDMGLLLPHKNPLHEATLHPIVSLRIGLLTPAAPPRGTSPLIACLHMEIVSTSPLVSLHFGILPPR